MSESNRLKDLEETAKKKLKQWYRHRSKENLEHLKKATGDWLAAERAQQERAAWPRCI